MLCDRDFSLITNNCLGGIISHDLQLPFNSPTVNLFMKGNSFILFCEHLDEYLSVEPLESKELSTDYPVGILPSEYGDIQLHFMHEPSFEVAKQNWLRRRERVHPDKVVVIAHLPWPTKDVAERFEKLPFSRKCLICAGKKRAHTSSCIAFPKPFFYHRFHEGKTLEYGPVAVRRYYARMFDYVTFLNTGALRKSSWFLTPSQLIRILKS